MPKSKRAEYIKNPKLCKQCGKPLLYRKHWYNTFCGKHCSGTFNWNNGKSGWKHISSKGSKRSIEFKAKVSSTKRRLYAEGKIKIPSPRSRWFVIKGQKVQGTWVRNLALKFEEWGIKWEKLQVNRFRIPYEINGVIRSYTPDFYLKDYDVYLEVKGYWWGKDEDKMDAVLSQHPNLRLFIIENDEYNFLIKVNVFGEFS